LGGLGGDDLVRLHPKLVRMTLGQLLHPVGARIEHVYFPESGMVSMLTVMKSGEQIETAIIGREGVIGGWVAIDGVNTNTQSTVQIEGSAQQVSTARFLETYRASDTFRSAMNAYQGVILFQAQQSAGCHAIHSVEARLCRWLLLSQDILESEHVPLTQEFLSHMLGVRRTSVSLCLANRLSFYIFRFFLALTEGKPEHVRSPYAFLAKDLIYELEGDFEINLEWLPYTLSPASASTMWSCSTTRRCSSTRSLGSLHCRSM
jgi:CRP-like cAMP-binding protein